MPEPARTHRIADVLRLYRGQTLRCRCYLAVRRLLLPLREIDRLVPRDGEILELACGYGLLAAFLAASSPSRRVSGLDIMEERIAVARQACASLRNLRFDHGDLYRSDARGLDAVLLIDTLHYFPFEEQQDILRQCRAALDEGGQLLLRLPVVERSLRFRLNQLQETVMVGLRFTKTKSGRLHFGTVQEMTAALEATGFAVDRVWPPSRLRPYTDTLFVARARG